MNAPAPTPLVVTKAQLREVIGHMLRLHRAAGVPDDGVAEILAQWTAAHLQNGTKVSDPPQPSPAGEVVFVDEDVPFPAWSIPSWKDASSTPERAPAARPPKPLTKAQIEELKRLAEKRQATHDAQRARVQNNLYFAGLARFIDHDGAYVSLTNGMGMKNIFEVCEITDAGRKALAEHLKLPPPNPRHCKVATRGCLGRGASCDCNCGRCWHTDESKASRAAREKKRRKTTRGARS